MIGQLIGGRYQVIETLGSGGFCQTYIAKDAQKFDAKCVVKKLKPRSNLPENLAVATHLFEREAQTQYRLGNHSQIPQLLAYFRENQEFYLVQELIEGHNLGEELPPGKKLSESEVINLLENILDPLAFVHQQKVIHRDIKPPNLIRRDQDNKIVLIDFGAVKELAVTQVLNTQGETKILTNIGTPGYMPSEQSTGKARFSSDIYAVGIIGIQALTGKMPQELIEDPETAEIIWQQYAEVNPKLEVLLDRMVRYDFRERYRSASEALQAVRQLHYRPSLPLKLPKPKKDIVTSSAQPSKKIVSESNHELSWLAIIAAAAIIFGLAGWYAYWQLPMKMALKTIEESKEKGQYAKCMSLAQALSHKSSISTKLQILYQDCQNLQAQDYLNEAQKLAKERKYDQAILELNQISSETPLYSQAQTLLQEWNISNYEFYQNYQQAIVHLNQSDYPEALEELYQAAEKAIMVNQANLLLAEINKNEQKNFPEIAQELEAWQVLKETLNKADPQDYNLLYQRAKLKLNQDHNHHHTREFELLFAAAKKAIDNQQTEMMLAQLKQDREDRFRNFTIGHSEWTNLIQALEQKNKQFLD